MKNTEAVGFYTRSLKGLRIWESRGIPTTDQIIDLVENTFEPDKTSTLLILYKCWSDMLEVLALGGLVDSYGRILRLGQEFELPSKVRDELIAKGVITYSQAWLRNKGLDLHDLLPDPPRSDRRFYLLVHPKTDENIVVNKWGAPEVSGKRKIGSDLQTFRSAFSRSIKDFYDKKNIEERINSNMAVDSLFRDLADVNRRLRGFN